LPDANSSINSSIDVNAATMFKISNRCKSACLVAALHVSHLQGGIGECTAFAVAKSVFCDTIDASLFLPFPLALGCGCGVECRLACSAQATLKRF